MTGNTHHIVKQIFKSESLENVPIEQLKSVTHQYPFFGLGHYLLSKKLYARKEESFADEIKRTALYFNNPFWLQWLLENSFDKKPMESKTPAPEEMQKPVATDPQLLQAETKNEIPLQIKYEEKQFASKYDDLLFEPYHTIDYFASLGIKFVAEEIPNDKFGMQLKSFTEWLKTMKKLPQKNMQGNVETADQAAIEGYAAHSIQQKEILTEAMAEVLAKQGKNEDAIGLYRKLSLINPSKSAYFAGKIEQLNPH